LLVLHELRVEHTLFALPFAYTGAIFAAHGLPSPREFLWITLAVLGARTAAMAANRYLDREIDARNPRTAQRALAAGTLAPSAMIGTALAGLALLVAAAFELNPLCVRLLPLAAIGVLLYPLCKRFTWMTHFALGAVDALAPLGAYIAMTGTVTATAWLLFGAVTVWVAGFDVIYALMDLAVDRAQQIRSLPARFGTAAGSTLPLMLHVCMLALLAAAGRTAHAGRVYLFGIAAAALLIAYEAVLLRRLRDVFTLNDRVFAANMAFSLVFLTTTAAGFAL